MTPTIADTIVTAGGAGAMTKMKSAVGKMTSSAKTAILTAKQEELLQSQQQQNPHQQVQHRNGKQCYEE